MQKSASTRSPRTERITFVCRCGGPCHGKGFLGRPAQLELAARVVGGPHPDGCAWARVVERLWNVHSGVVRPHVVLAVHGQKYVFERSYVRVHVCMTLFVSPGSAVGWATVRGTGPEQKNPNPPHARIWMPPCQPTQIAYFGLSYLGSTVSSNHQPGRFGGVLGVLLKAAGSAGHRVFAGASAGVPKTASRDL